MKKSVDDILSSSQDVINHSINQAISLTSSTSTSFALNARKRSPSPSSKSVASSSSPRVSTPPRASKTKSDLHLSPSYSNIDKLDSEELFKSSDSSINQQERPVDDKDGKDKDKLKPYSSKLAERAKKKAWYSALYPSYKSRSEDFKKLFKDVPDEERLVVDYSCAIQREILAHGRLYVSQNYLCFHANIIVWETRLTLKWKDVTAISKEKTARVIPNAILVTTKTDKHFLTSFTSRDKTYLMLFRVWQNALMDKPMAPQEIWQTVHSCYGEQLGLTSDDEYIDPYEDTAKQSADSVSEEQSVCDLQVSSSSSNLKLNDSEKESKKEKKDKSKSKKILSSKSFLKSSASKSSLKSTISAPISNLPEYILDHQETPDNSKCVEQLELPTDMSDSTDSDKEKMEYVNNSECTSLHQGRQLVHTILPINIDILFQLLFSKSKFFMDFHVVRKTTDLEQGEWEPVESDEAIKKRVISLTVAITQTVGPKSSHVTETQLMRNCSIPGQLYSIDASSVNAGIPYADSFYVEMHYCMKRTTDDHTVMSVHAQIKYKKSVWGVVKGFIEKNAWLGLEDFYHSLLLALQAEYCIPPAKSKSRKPRRSTTQQPQPLQHQQQKMSLTEDKRPQMATNMALTRKGSSLEENKYRQRSGYDKLSWIVIGLLVGLIFFNVILYIKLWKLEIKNNLDDYPNISHLKNPPKTPEEWLRLLQLQETLHAKEMQKWQVVLQTAIELLRKTEQSLSELQHLILKRITQRSKATDTFGYASFDIDNLKADINDLSKSDL